MNINLLDKKAVGLAKEYLNKEVEILDTLITMRRVRAFRELNYSGIFDYCVRRLRLSESQSFYFKSVAEKSEEVPEMKEAINIGRITLSQARRIVPVITKENHEEWIEKVEKLPQKELEYQVQCENPNVKIRERIKPVSKELLELRVSLDKKTEENLKVLRDILSSKLQRNASLSDVIAFAAETCRKKYDLETKNSSSRKTIPKPGRHPVSTPLKAQVFRRDKSQCTHHSPDGRRCEQKRWLHLHHLKEVSEGGLNTLENLTLLCHSHHQLLHEGGRRG